MQKILKKLIYYNIYQIFFHKLKIYITTLSTKVILYEKKIK